MTLLYQLKLHKCSNSEILTLSLYCEFVYGDGVALCRMSEYSKKVLNNYVNSLRHWIERKKQLCQSCAKLSTARECIAPMKLMRKCNMCSVVNEL